MAFIYKITNNINGKSYVGKTLNTVSSRFKEHICDSKHEVRKNRPLYKAFNKYGIENFRVETLEECDDTDASEREMFWIKELDTFHKGYNATLGGDGKQYVNRALIILLWLADKNIKFISDFTGYSRDTISDILKSYRVSSKEILSRANNDRKKSVDMYDLNGNYLRTFSSPYEASKFINNKHSRSHIDSVCRGKRKTAYGFIWKFSK